VSGANYLLLSGSAGSAGGNFARYPLKGRIYLNPRGVWCDADGPCLIFFHSAFQLITLVATDKPEAVRTVRAIARAGSGVRFFTRIGADFDVVGRHPYFSDTFWGKGNREIDSTMCRDYLAETLDLCGDHGLKVFTTMGSMSKNDAVEYDFHMMVADIVVASGHTETLAGAEHRNEPDQTSQYTGDPPKAWTLAKRTMQDFKAKVGCVITGGSWGDNDMVLASADGMDAMDTHANRSPTPEHVRHVHTVWNTYKFNGRSNKGIWRGEDPGPNDPYVENTRREPHASIGGDMFVGNNDPDYQFADTMVAAFTGQAQCWLNGPAVRQYCPIDSTAWGFLECPELLHTFMPKDVGVWAMQTPNPSWIIAPDNKRFVYAGLTAWGQYTRPPRPIGKRRVVTAAGLLSDGSGPVTLPEGVKSLLIVGEFA